MPTDIQSLQEWSWLLMLLALWTLPWKGVALWKAAKNNHKAWFVILLVANTLAILEIIYIFAFSKKKKEKEKEIIHTTLNI
ncbi:hypothetical protein KJ885_02835 [Patescibacteria group bacterium]|nr:hypothetical protein [Patescibacteria group bacterium]